VGDSNAPEASGLSESLNGLRVALLEARLESELASLVRRRGGEPVCVPALREVETDCGEAAARAIDAAGRSGAVVALATGVGLSRWLAVADRAGRGADLRAALGRATVVCRGPKPVAVLKGEGLAATLRAPAPHTTRELLTTLEGVEMAGRDFVYVHDGGGARTVPAWATGRGAAVSELQPYRYDLPADLAPLRALVSEIAGGKIGAVLFTSQVQARNLVAVAEATGDRAALVAAMHDEVIVGAVGPTTGAALGELGIPPHITPAQGSMGALVLALAKRASH
jgi:uroporphyrinogen-III synthase